MNVREYRRLCQKNEQENYFFDKYIFRRFSIYLTILFIKLRITANQATFFSLLSALSACGFLIFNTPSAMFGAAALIFLYYMLDHVDGELARYYIGRGLQKPSLAGQYFDVLVHKYSTNLMLFFTGISVYRLFNYPFAVIVGFIACICMSSFPNLLASQVIVQKIAGDREIVWRKDAADILSLLEKKKRQISKLTSKNPLVKARKIITEALFFPGSLLTIMLVTLADIVIPTFTLFSFSVNLRLLFLVLVTPVYAANTVRQALKWMRYFRQLA